MKFSVERASFLDAVTKLQRVVGAKSSMPVLEGILISAEKEKITLIAYNLEIGLKKEIEASCTETGDIVINARILGEILRKLNGNFVEIVCDSKLNCHIKCGETNFDIMGMASTDFPEIPSVTKENCFEVEGKLFSEMVKKTIFAAAQTEGNKPILTGLNIEFKDNYMKIVAIDGYRLAVRKCKTNVNKEVNFTATSKAIAEVIKLIDEETENILINVSQRLLSFYINGYEFISRLLDGEFVGYQKTIPGEHTQRIVFNTRELLNTAERVSLLISESFSTPIRCYFNELNVVFTCATSVGRATETVDRKIEGENFEIGLNSRYLLDALRAIEDEEIEILFNGANMGVVINPLSDDHFKYMIMPMRLK